jgi:hypothetical protein
MDKSRELYFGTTLDFIKWNTAFAVAAILWFGNYLINTTTSLNFNQWVAAIIILGFFVGSILWSVVIFYFVSKYFNKYWVLCSRWRESVMCSTPPMDDASRVLQSEVITEIRNHYQNLPEEAKSFDRILFFQWILFCLGLGSLAGFIVCIK